MRKSPLRKAGATKPPSKSEHDKRGRIESGLFAFPGNTTDSRVSRDPDRGPNPDYDGGHDHYRGSRDHACCRSENTSNCHARRDNSRFGCDSRPDCGNSRALRRLRRLRAVHGASDRLDGYNSRGPRWLRPTHAPRVECGAGNYPLWRWGHPQRERNHSARRWPALPYRTETFRDDAISYILLGRLDLCWLGLFASYIQNPKAE